ncbi:MAG: phosphodiester glycosidase family protein [Clostridiales bacterium]|nr:phosphodiester glycosidase family protein [Clostridiales bacterium]
MLILLVVAVTAYCLVAFSDIPILLSARDIWIETAMTTADHQWLATLLFPRSVIESTMGRQVMPDDVTQRHDLVDIGARRDESDDMQAAYADAGGGRAAGAGGSGAAGSAGGGGAGRAGASGSGVGAAGDGGGAGGAGASDYGGNNGYGGRGGYGETVFDGAGDRGAMGQQGAYGGAPGQGGAAGGAGAGAGTDALGNKIIVDDADQGIRIVEVKGATYVGRVLFVADPSRVVVRHTRNPGAIGQLIGDYLTQHGAIAGINGNGFDDPEGHGKGGSIIGWSVSGGKEWGTGPRNEYSSSGFSEDDVLVVGKMSSFAEHGIRDMVQYGPALIVDGKLLIKGSAGWGLQPRTAIGQLGDGTVALATVDGRQPGHSVGITAGDLASLLYDYGCVNAGLCDGGSSSVMMYDGSVIGSPSTPMKDTGRYLPNAILVLRK